jgi:Non-repetitive/WGA-negative nucleoporin C-terminal
VYSIDAPSDGLKLPNKLSPWTSSPDVIGSLTPQYDITLSVLREFQSAAPSDPDSQARRTRQQTENMEREDTRLALEETLASLAEMLCKICVERVTWCKALAEDEEAKSGAEDIWAQYLAKRGDWIKPLGIPFKSLLTPANFGRPDKALDIAEVYRDYKTLVELCLEPREDDLSRQQRVHERLEYYLMLFGEEFAFTLYNFYLQNRIIHFDMTKGRNVC